MSETIGLTYFLDNPIDSYLDEADQMVIVLYTVFSKKLYLGFKEISSTIDDASMDDHKEEILAIAQSLREEYKQGIYNAQSFFSFLNFEEILSNFENLKYLILWISNQKDKELVC